VTFSKRVAHHPKIWPKKVPLSKTCLNSHIDPPLFWRTPKNRGFWGGSKPPKNQKIPKSAKKCQKCPDPKKVTFFSLACLNVHISACLKKLYFQKKYKKLKKIKKTKKPQKPHYIYRSKKSQKSPKIGFSGGGRDTLINRSFAAYWN
jgi:hypothetical protein